MERLRKHRMDLAQCSLFLLELTTALIRLARAGDVELEAVFGPGFTGVVSISQFRSLDELEHWCVDRATTAGAAGPASERLRLAGRWSGPSTTSASTMPTAS